MQYHPAFAKMKSLGLTPCEPFLAELAALVNRKATGNLKRFLMGMRGETDWLLVGMSTCSSTCTSGSSKLIGSATWRLPTKMDGVSGRSLGLHMKKLIGRMFGIAIWRLPAKLDVPPFTSITVNKNVRPAVAESVLPTVVEEVHWRGVSGLPLVSMSTCSSTGTSGVWRL